jgi:hypothetical protein
MGVQSLKHDRFSTSRVHAPSDAQDVGGVQECCDKRNKVRASQSMVKWNNYAISVLLLACVAGGAWLLYAGTPIIDSLHSLTNKMVSEVCLLHALVYMAAWSAFCDVPLQVCTLAVQRKGVLCTLFTSRLVTEQAPANFLVPLLLRTAQDLLDRKVVLSDDGRAV